MRILWVKAGGLVPPDTGGKIRSYNILRQLVKRHKVTLFTFYRKYDGDGHSELAHLFHQVVCVPLPLPASHTFSEAALYARNLLTLQPYSIAKFCRPQVAGELRDLLRDYAFDVVVCDFVNAGGVIPWELSVPKILFTHNVEAQIWWRHYQNARNPLWRAVSWLEYNAMNRTEQAYVKLADHVLAVSEADRDHFSHFIDASKITVIPTGVDIDFFQPDSRQPEGKTLVFTGSMDWIPNEDAMLYFLKAIFPHIQQQVPDVALWIVGRRPSERLMTVAAQESGVRVTGQVDDIRPYVRDAAVYVVPLRIGGGTRLKIFEAMAMGKAVVSTAIGAEGLPVQQGDNIFLADQPKEFANKVVALLKDPQYRMSLGVAARQLVEEKYSWELVSADFERALVKVVAPTLGRPIECNVS